MLVDKENLIIGRERILTDARAELDMSEHRSWSWFTRLARMLLVLCSKTYWCLATF